MSHDQDHHRRHDDHDTKHEHRADHGHAPAHAGAHAASAHQAGPHASAGVRADGADGRYSNGLELADVRGRILAIYIGHHGTELLIGAGREQGVQVGMTGYLMGKDTYVAQLDVISADKNRCRVRVDATPDQVRQHEDGILINPSSTPAKASQTAKDYKSRVVKLEMVDGRTRMMVAGGSGQGLKFGMKGTLLDDAGRRIAGFELDEIHSRTSMAFVATTFDDVNRAASVIINPS